MCGFGPWLFPTSKFTIQNKCSYDVDPIIANTNCGYSPRELFRCIFLRSRGKTYFRSVCGRKVSIALFIIMMSVIDVDES